MKSLNILLEEQKSINSQIDEIEKSFKDKYMKTFADRVGSILMRPSLTQPNVQALRRIAETAELTKQMTETAGEWKYCEETYSLQGVEVSVMSEGYCYDPPSHYFVSIMTCIDDEYGPDDSYSVGCWKQHFYDVLSKKFDVSELTPEMTYHLLTDVCRDAIETELLEF